MGKLLITETSKSVAAKVSLDPEASNIMLDRMGRVVRVGTAFITSCTEESILFFGRVNFIS